MVVYVYRTIACGCFRAPTFTQNEVLRRACKNRSVTTDRECVCATSYDQSKSTGKSCSTKVDMSRGGTSTHMLLCSHKRSFAGECAKAVKEFLYIKWVGAQGNDEEMKC